MIQAVAGRLSAVAIEPVSAADVSIFFQSPALLMGFVV
jgi:hypothetical protein